MSRLSRQRRSSLSSLSAAQKRALQTYKGSGYGEINSVLRDNAITSAILSDRSARQEMPVLETIRALDSVMKNDGRVRNQTLYRGIPRWLLTLFLAQGVQINKSFTSCSLSLRGAQLFTTDDCCILMFELQNPLKFYDFSAFETGIRSAALQEAEILIQRNTQFTHLRETNTEGVYTCTLEPYVLHPLTRTREAAQLRSERMAAYLAQLDSSSSSEEEESD